jgi:hypothetical protein
MTTFLFWNLNKKPLSSLIAKLVEEHDVDILIFAECLMKPDVLLPYINRADRQWAYSPSDSCERIKIYTRFSPEFIKPVLDGREFTTRHLTIPDKIDILLTAIHFPSKLSWSDASQAMRIVEVASKIRIAESRVGHLRTVLVGDLNMNPFEDGIISANGFHAVMSKMVAGKQSRVVQGERYPFFYNPMWSLFGDAPQEPPGTYYYTSGLISFFWNMFDQVLIRPELLSSFSHDNLNILTSAGNTSLLTSDGRPNSKMASDHLPLLFSLDLQKESSK